MASDHLVTCKAILQAQLEYQQLGAKNVWPYLESREPELAGYLMEHSTELFHQLRETGAPPKRMQRLHRSVESLLLVCMIALQRSYEQLWKDDAEEEASNDPKIKPLPPPYSSEGT